MIDTRGMIRSIQLILSHSQTSRTLSHLEEKQGDKQGTTLNSYLRLEHERKNKGRNKKQQPRSSNIGLISIASITLRVISLVQCLVVGTPL